MQNDKKIFGLQLVDWLMKTILDHPSNSYILSETANQIQKNEWYISYMVHLFLAQGELF